jgi:hypothetical protein
VLTLLSRSRILVASALLLVLTTAYARVSSQSGAAVTAPVERLGSAIGDDYFLATYTQLEAYWTQLAVESDRLLLADIGRTEEGRTQWMAVVSAPENLRNLDRYRDIARRLALADGVSEAEARALAAEGKTIVWIDGGLHATEVLGAQQLIELVYQLVSRSDPETLRVLRDVIVLVAHANPDGHELVANWYMQEREPTRRSFAGLPRAYQKYIGHDNNRDFYMSTQAETLNINRVLYREWFPQIVYDHHQTGPPGTVMYAPPFGGPSNYVLDPLVTASIDLIAGAMHARFKAEGKPGVTMRNGSAYSTWWNGGLRTTAYFHNQIGLLTETTGSPTPTEIARVASRQVASADLPYPITPQLWRFRQSVEYSLSANRAVLDSASRYRERLLLGTYRMGRNAIERGSRDTWVVASGRAGGRSSRGRREEPSRDMADRDPRGYILPADQPDFLTATKFIDALLKTGVAVHRATAPFIVGGRTYLPGSYVVKTAQAFGPHVLDMFEPQYYPDDNPDRGGPPTSPYDSAGWTLAYQMGVEFDRVLDGFDGPFERVDDALPPEGRVVGPPNPAGYFVSHHQNDAFIAVNRLLAAGQRVYWLRDRSAGGEPTGGGVMYIAATLATRPILERAAADLGLTFTGVAAEPVGDALALSPVRIALWDQYGGSSQSGWTRWLLERYEFPFEVVYAQTLDAGDLASRYDVLILTDEATLDTRTGGALAAERAPVEYRTQTGAITSARTLPQLRRFVEAGGTVMAIGRATAIGEKLGLPVSNALVETDRRGTPEPLPPSQYYVPASVLRVRVDNTTPLGYGFESQADIFFDNSPVFRLSPASPNAQARRVAWFAEPSPLRSGWALGQHYLENGVAVVDATLGRGRVLLFGPEINFRAQSHGTFKFLFNGVYYGKAMPARLIGPRAGVQ